MDIPINDNDRTIQSYQEKVQEYIAAARPEINPAVRVLINTSLDLIPRSGMILEVGSGPGKEAEYILSKGFDVECSDAVPNFVEILQKKGFKTRMLNLLTQDIGGMYDMIFANAVLLHFNPEETQFVSQKICGALNKNGIFTVRVKKGNGAFWSVEKLGKPRYFYHWDPAEFRIMLEKCGFQIVSLTESYTEHNDTNWIGIIAQKS